MLYSLRGILVYTDESSAAVECAGVAYRCQTTLSTLSRLDPVGAEVLLYTHLNVREDAVDLFGFADQRELRFFRMLIAITGVGPKAALSILSNLSPDRLSMCIATGDFKSITAAQGVGPKLAQRVVLELKDKIKNMDAIGGAGALPTDVNLDAGNASEAISALVALGYAQADAAMVVAKTDPNASVEEMIKAALRGLSGK